MPALVSLTYRLPVTALSRLAVFARSSAYKDAESLTLRHAAAIAQAPGHGRVAPAEATGTSADLRRGHSADPALGPGRPRGHLKRWSGKSLHRRNRRRAISGLLAGDQATPSVKVPSMLQISRVSVLSRSRSVAQRRPAGHRRRLRSWCSYRCLRNFRARGHVRRGDPVSSVAPRASLHNYSSIDSLHRVGGAAESKLCGAAAKALSRRHHSRDTAGTGNVSACVLLVRQLHRTHELRLE